jgi:hypothetical protein
LARKKKKPPAPSRHKGISKTFRASAEEWARWRTAAEAAELTLSDWLRLRADYGGTALLDSSKSGLPSLSDIAAQVEP